MKKQVVEILLEIETDMPLDALRNKDVWQDGLVAIQNPGENTTVRQVTATVTQSPKKEKA